MALKIDKFKEGAKKFSEKAQEAGGKAATVANEVTHQAGSKSYDVYQDLREKYYSPVMYDEYMAEDYDLPNLIVIVDEDRRKNVDICEGAIGWLKIVSKAEVLYMYDEFVDDSGLLFYPQPSMDSLYMVDRFDKKRFINVSSYLAVAQSEKMTELKQIAHKLGAKYCKLVSYEGSKQTVTTQTKIKGNASLKGKKAPKGSLDSEINSSKSEEHSTQVMFEQKFDSTGEATMPELKFYAHDAEIKALIDSRLNPETSNTTEYRMGIDCRSSTSMSFSMAHKVDAVLKKMGLGASLNVSKEVKTESQNTLEFYVEF